MTQNVRFLFDAGICTHSGKEWNYTEDFVRSRIRYFADLFKKEDADIIFLQELASENVLKQIIHECHIDYSYFIATPDQNGVGNAILVKTKEAVYESLPPVSPLPVFITGDVDTIGPRLWARRDFTCTKISYNNKTLYLLGIHLKSNFAMPEVSPEGVPGAMTTQIAFADGMIRSELFRASQAKKAREIIDEFFKADPEAYVIVAGDFNTQPSQPIMRMIQGGIKELSGSLFSVSKLITKEQRYSIIIGDDHYLADHILVSKSLQTHVVSARVRTEDLDGEASSELGIGSDHAALIVELQ